MSSFFCKLNKTLEKINGLRTARRSYQELTGCVFFVVFISIIYLVIIRDPFPHKGAELRHASNNGTILEWRNVLAQTPNNALGISRVTELMPQGNFLGNNSPELVTSSLLSVLFLDFESLTFAEEMVDQSNNESSKESSEIAINVKIHSFILGVLTAIILYLLFILIRAIIVKYGL
jgi:hypothetical protein